MSVLDTGERDRAHLTAEALVERGLTAIARSDAEDHASFVRGRSAPGIESFSVLVPEARSLRASELVHGVVGEEVDRLLQEPLHPAQQHDDYFALRSRMDIEMPHAGRRAKERAARRALAELDGRPVGERPDQPPSQGCRRQVVAALCVLLALMIGVAVILLARGEGLTEPGCSPKLGPQPTDEACG